MRNEESSNSTKQSLTVPEVLVGIRQAVEHLGRTPIIVNRSFWNDYNPK